MSKVKVSRTYLILEMLTVYVTFPLLIFFLKPYPFLPFLWIIAIFCLIILLRDNHFKKETLWRYRLVIPYTTLLIHSFLVSFIMIVLIYLIKADLLFSLIKTNVLVWLFVIILYPLFSVYPQELIYRSFFFHRYRNLFTDTKILIAINALLFGYMHIIFHNWPAVILTMLGGVYFAILYQRSGSIIFVSIVHAIYGILVFTLGLGEFFYHGSIETVLETFKL